MSTDFRAELQALVSAYDEHGGKWPQHHEEALFAAVDRARAALAEPEPEGPTPQPADGDWRTGLPPFAGFYYVRGLLDQSIGGDDRAVYVNPEHFVWGFSQWDDPEWIGLDSDITPENIQWKPAGSAPWPVPVSERLPGPEDCDVKGRCWIHMPDIGTAPSWRLVDPREIGPYHTHWLPAHALPLPGEVEG